MEFVHKCEVIKGILYYDIFNHPLTKNEIYENCYLDISQFELEIILMELMEEGILMEKKGFYQVTNSHFSNIQKRVFANQQAQKALPIAYEYAQQIGGLPFVKGVCLSGNLSKGYFDRNSKINYFIITTHNRVWLAKYFFEKFKRSLPSEEHKYLDANYFISERKLAIRDENKFVATELINLVPLINYDLFKKLMSKNSWLQQWFPNKDIHNGEFCQDLPETQSKYEVFLESFGGDLADDFLMKKNYNRLKKEFSKMTDEEFELNFRSEKHVSKNHPQGYQNSTLKKWQKKIEVFEYRYDMYLVK